MKGVLNASTRVSLWDSLMFGRLAMGFANVRTGTRVLMLVLEQAKLIKKLSKTHGPAPAWSDAAAHAAILEATVVHYGHAQDERSLCTHSSPSDKRVTWARAKCRASRRCGGLTQWQ